MFKVFLEKDKCIGCGTCAAVCPANFEMGDDGKAIVLNQEIETLGCNRLAEENCPVRAIEIKAGKKSGEPEAEKTGNIEE